MKYPVPRVYTRSARANASGSAPGRSSAKSASLIPICSGSRGSPTCFGRTAGGWVKSARKAAACATSHSRAVTGTCGGRGRWAESAVFFVCLGAEEARAGSRGCVMPDLKQLGSLIGQGSICSPLASQPEPPRHLVRTPTGSRRPPEAKATRAGHGRAHDEALQDAGVQQLFEHVGGDSPLAF